MPQIDIKNIIQIIPNMEIGGAEKTVLEIGAYLKNTHYEPIVLTSGGGMIENLKEKNTQNFIVDIKTYIICCFGMPSRTTARGAPKHEQGRNTRQRAEVS